MRAAIGASSHSMVKPKRRCAIAWPGSRKPQPSGSLGEAGAALGVLAAISPTGQTTQAINQDKSISKDDAKLAGLQQRLSELTKETEGVPEEKLREAAKLRDNALGLIGVTDDKIEEKKKAIDKIKSELSHARKEAQKHSSSTEAALLTEREELATDLAAIFEEAKDQFRDAMRGKVGGDASELFPESSRPTRISRVSRSTRTTD